MDRGYNLGVNDQVATKQDLLALEKRFNAKLAGLENRLEGRFDARLETRIDALRTELVARMEVLETKVLSAFARANDARARDLESSTQRSKTVLRLSTGASPRSRSASTCRW